MYYTRLSNLKRKGVKVNKLKEIRTERGLSQLKLSFLTGIQPADISRIENDRLRPFPSWRSRLAKVLGELETDLFPENGGQDAE